MIEEHKLEKAKGMSNFDFKFILRILVTEPEDIGGDDDDDIPFIDLIEISSIVSGYQVVIIEPYGELIILA